MNLNNWLPPRQYLHFGPAMSPSGSCAEGIGILSPLLPQNFVGNSHESVLKHLLSAIRLARDFGAQIVGLGGFTSVFGNEGIELAAASSMAITSGNTFTAALVIEGIRRAAVMKACSLNNCLLAVIGATGDIGSICTRLLAHEVGQVAIAARNETKLREFAEKVSSESGKKVQVFRRAADAVKEADLVLTAASSIAALIEPEALRPGAVVCDVGYPANVAQSVFEKRTDVLVFEGGLASWSGYESLGVGSRLSEFSPFGTLHGCFAETLILALEGKFVPFSLGRGNITENAIHDIQSLADKHGFGLAPLSYGNRIYADLNNGKVARADGRN